MLDTIIWGHDRMQLAFGWTADSSVRLTGVTRSGRQNSVYALPIAEIVTAAAGRVPASDRLAHTATGERLRYRSHSTECDGARRVLRIEQSDGVITVTSVLELFEGATAVRARTVVVASGSAPVVLRSVTSWSSGFTPAPADLAQGEPDALAGWTRTSGVSDWLGEGRWHTTTLRGPELPELAEHITGHNPRSAIEVISTGTWSTGKNQPIAFLENADAQLAWGWQIEHNGAWRWEVGEDTAGGYFALSGPTEADASWTRILQPGDVFESVPVVVAIGESFESVIAELTAFRRVTRRQHPDNTELRVVFNDYMNTLNGDPTTQKLLPLIEAAASVGAEIFCVDAGWYDDGGNWWDSVGEWRPSTTRFPGGFGEVFDAIRAAGMAPGLWLEPEVVGVRSPLTESLPLEAFLLRGGQRVEEHGRFHLDLRHPAAVAHLDTVVDTLVADFGIEFFKFDYNINPGAGTDHDADSLGDGLLEHNRAHLAWLDALLDRHPQLVIENCSSGAMRSDQALLSRLAMQSTSDQQDFAKYPPIAASAPVSMLPEQAANWAYPQPSMNREESAFALVTGMLGRFYLSGYVNEMSEAGRAQIVEAVEAAKLLRPELVTSLPHWPLGLPGWTDPWVALALRVDSGDELLSLWNRSAGAGEVVVPLPHLIGHELLISPVFPSQFDPWLVAWDAVSGTLSVRTGDDPVSARTLRLRSLSPGA